MTTYRWYRVDLNFRDRVVDTLSIVMLKTMMYFFPESKILKIKILTSGDNVKYQLLSSSVILILYSILYTTKLIMFKKNIPLYSYVIITLTT